MIPTWFLFFQIHYSRRLLITYWLNDFLSGNLVSFRIVSSVFKLLLHPDAVSSFVWSRYLWSIFFCNLTLSTRLLEKQADYQRRLYELYRGFLGHAPREKFWRIGLAETPYPAFPGSNAINLQVSFVELFSESCYSWFPSRSAKIHDSQVSRTKIHDFYMFCKYDSWFMIPLPPLIQLLILYHKVLLTNYLAQEWKN